MNRDPTTPSSNRGSGDGETDADRQAARVTDQALPDRAQTLADAEQAAADTDQAAAEVDQRASDRDQMAADRALAESPAVDAARQQAHDLSQADREASTNDRETTTTGREASTTERAATTVLRVQTASDRLDAASRRDEASRLSDLAAEARDRAADARDRAAAQLDPEGPVAEARKQAAADRARAASDRQRAAADRQQAAIDRQHVRAALSQAHLDELTGTYRRGLGTLVLQQEINRARHSDRPLVLAFVDVDGLKQVNDRDGHAAGDAVLIDVAATLSSHLRSYDPVVRFGGDEFICAFSDFGLDGVRRRFDSVRSALDEKGCSISVGFAELQSGDTLDDLTARGDAALYEAKNSRNGDSGANRRRPLLRRRTRSRSAP